jgi:AcrR family transcriptional regulator
MPRPRVHDLGRVLDAAEALAVNEGPAAVTIRALSNATSMSNGALYHAFGTRAGLLAQAWIRAGERFLQLQRDAVEDALNAGDQSIKGRPGVDAVIAAALCPAVFHDQNPASAKYLLTVARADLLHSDELPDDLANRLRRLDNELGAIFIRLSLSLWDRKDKQAVALIRDCVVHLPTALLLRRTQTADNAARRRLSAAVRAVLSIPPAED